MEDDKTAAQTEAEPESESIYRMKRVYLKDLSFESPNAPGLFDKLGEAENVPVMRTNIGISNEKQANDEYEIAVRLTVLATNQSGEKSYFLLEVEYAGVFIIKDIPDEDRELLFRVHCPQILYPYARHMIWSVVNAGGFPNLFIQDIDFSELSRVE